MRALNAAVQRGGQVEVANENGLTGFYKLEELRCTTVAERVKKDLDDEGWRSLHVSLLNSYLNGYANKLCLPQTRTKAGVVKINLDKQHLNQLSREKGYNPLVAYLNAKKIPKEPLHEVFRKKQAFVNSALTKENEDKFLKAEMVKADH